MTIPSMVDFSFPFADGNLTFTTSPASPATCRLVATMLLLTRKPEPTDLVSNRPIFFSRLISATDPIAVSIIFSRGICIC